MSQNLMLAVKTVLALICVVMIANAIGNLKPAKADCPVCLSEFWADALEEHVHYCSLRH